MIQLEIRHIRGSGGCKTLRTDKDLLKIGRSKKNDVVLPDKSVTKLHAEIHVKQGLYVVDLKSANGTFVNKRRIPPVDLYPFPENTPIQVGVYLLKISKVHSASGTIDSERMHLQSKASPPHSPESIEVDKEFKQVIHKKLLSLIDLRRIDFNALSDDELREKCRNIVLGIVKKMEAELPSRTDIDTLIEDVLNEALGLGPLEEFLSDNSISEIMVNRFDQIYVEKNGRLTLSPKTFTNDQSVLNIINRIVGPIGRRIDESSPLVDARLKDGSRVNAIIPPLALNGPCITIRKFSKESITIDKLVSFNSLNSSMAKFIRICVEHKKNIFISGGTGSGKTTLLNIFSSFIQETERTVTIEDAAELSLKQDHVIRLESRPPNSEGKGEIKIRDLVKNALRMRPDRIIIGECRGGEALDMLQAMNTGHDGSMTTGHANSPNDMLNRLETMVLMSGEDLPSRAIREQIASAIDIIVQQKRFSCGSRKITKISEVVGIDENKILLHDIFYFKEDGMDSTGKVKGRFISTGWIPQIFQDLFDRNVEIDMGIFHN